MTTAAFRTIPAIPGMPHRTSVALMRVLGAAFERRAAQRRQAATIDRLSDAQLRDIGLPPRSHHEVPKRQFSVGPW